MKKITASKFTSALKSASKSIQNAFAPPSSTGMRGLYARPAPPAILGLKRIPSLRVHYDSGTLQKVEKPEWENVDEDVVDKVSILSKGAHDCSPGSKYDITRLKVDAIVNAANSSLLGYISTGRALDGCEVGEAKITRGHRLPAAHIIHTVGPIFDEYRSEKEASEFLKSCYLNSLKLAVEKDLKTIAFCSISTGVYGYPIEAATKEAMIATRTFLDSDDGKKIDRVIFCTFSQADTTVYKDLAPFYFPTSKEYPAERDVLPEIPFGVELPPQPSSTPAEDTDEPLTEDEVLVPRTPNRKASTRLKRKPTDDDGDVDMLPPAASLSEALAAGGADPASSSAQTPAEETPKPEESKEGEEAKVEQAGHPTLYDTEVVDGVKLEGPSVLPTTVAMNVPGPSEAKAEEAAPADSGADAPSAPPEEQPKAKTEEELVKEQELAQANSVPAAGPPPPEPEPAQVAVEEKTAEVPEPVAVEKKEEVPEPAAVEKKEEVPEPAAEEKKEEVPIPASAEPSNAPASEGITEKKPEQVEVAQKPEAPAPAASEEKTIEEKNDKSSIPDTKDPEVKSEPAPVKPEDPAKPEAPTAKPEDVQAPEPSAEEAKADLNPEAKKGDENRVVVPEPAKAAEAPAVAASATEEPAKE
ncbi:hypothetical protein FRB90_007062 [Tulasnella sp. 427]|nr:hypothetical protein FRB90_007062 [Tulasnella sp. 427]